MTLRCLLSCRGLLPSDLRLECRAQQWELPMPSNPSQPWLDVEQCGGGAQAQKTQKPYGHNPPHRAATTLSLKRWDNSFQGRPSQPSPAPPPTKHSALSKRIYPGAPPREMSSVFLEQGVSRLHRAKLAHPRRSKCFRERRREPVLQPKAMEMAPVLGEGGGTTVGD